MRRHIGKTVVDTRSIEVTWYDTWKLAISTHEQILAECRQHLLTKGRYIYKNEMGSNPALSSPGKRAGILFSNVIYDLETDPQNSDKRSIEAVKNLESSAIIAFCLRELEEVTNFMKDEIGDHPAVNHYLQRKKAALDEVANLRRKFKV